MTENIDSSDEIEDDRLISNVEFFSTEDEQLKLLGELLSNESSRKILLLLTSQELAANDIAERTGMRLSLIIHHIRKMQEIGIVKVNKIRKNSKNRQVKYYLAKQGMIILPTKSTDVAKKSKTLSNSLKRVLRYSMVGIAGIATWIGTNSKKPDEMRISDRIPSSDEITDFTGGISTLNETVTSISKSALQDDTLVPFFVTTIVICCGLFLIWLSKKSK